MAPQRYKGPLGSDPVFRSEELVVPKGVAVSSAIPDQFHYDDVGEVRPLPDWARYFAAAGELAARYRNDGQRIVIAIAVPTRSHCAAFAALGAVTASASSADVFIASESQFEHLRELRHGAAVRLRKGNKALKGRFTGIEQLANNGVGKPYARIQVQSRGGGSLTHLVPPESAGRIEIVAGTRRELPKQQKGHRIRSSIEFADEFFPDRSLERLALKSKVLCAIVGRANALVKEIEETQLSVRSAEDEASVHGTLQDVVRIRSFGSETDHFLAEVVPVDSSSDESGDEVPPVVIFDGAYGFLKKRSSWRQSNALVIVDRTENYFDSAVDTLNQDFAKRRIDGEGDSKYDGLPSAPPGVELFAYEERSGCSS